MGRVKNNQVTKGFSGKFGDDIVFRQLDNQTIFTRRTQPSGPPSDGQTSVRNRFTEASLYASAAVDNPQANTEYRLLAAAQGLKNAYTAAVTDFLTQPEIASVFTTAYKGNVGDLFSIKPKAAYKITGIDVTLMDSAGAVIESGPAVANGQKWRYAATKANAIVAGTRIRLVARDRLGKELAFEQVL